VVRLDPRRPGRLHAAARHDCHRCDLRHCARRRYGYRRDRPRRRASEARSVPLLVSVPLPYPPPFHLNRKNHLNKNFIAAAFYSGLNSISKKAQPDQFKTSSRERYAPAQPAEPMALPRKEEP
jgi:hypothetical protein